MGGVGVTMLLLLLQGSHALLGTRYPLLVARTPPRCARAPSLAKMEEREQPVASWPLSGSEGKSGNKKQREAAEVRAAAVLLASEDSFPGLHALRMQHEATVRIFDQ